MEVYEVHRWFTGEIKGTSDRDTKGGGSEIRLLAYVKLSDTVIPLISLNLMATTIVQLTKSPLLNAQDKFRYGKLFIVI